MGHVHSQKLFGSQVRSLRQQAGISQADLALRSGIFRTHLSRIECGTGNPTLAAIVALAQALNVEPRALLDSRSTSGSPVAA